MRTIFFVIDFWLCLLVCVSATLTHHAPKKKLSNATEPKWENKKKSVNLIAFCAFWDFSMDFTYTIPMTITRNGNSYLKLLRNDVDFFEIEQKKIFWLFLCVADCCCSCVFYLKLTYLHFFVELCVARHTTGRDTTTSTRRVCIGMGARVCKCLYSVCAVRVRAIALFNSFLFRNLINSMMSLSLSLTSSR